MKLQKDCILPSMVPVESFPVEKLLGKAKFKRGEDGKKRWTIVEPGLIDFTNTKAKAKELGIELRGGGADESPECYKKLEDVLSYQGDTIKVLHRLEPIGVAMAGA